MKPVVLITGCASGIGLELAKKLYASEEFRVVITARAHHLPVLRELFQPKFNFIIRELDITSDENIYQLVDEICRHWKRVDIIVNNAAVCYRGVIEHMDAESEMHQLATNYLGPMSLARAVLPIMREQRTGQIINVSSVSGLLAMPTMASYSASKHALAGASEALWYEAQPFGIKVNLVELGFVKSLSFQNVVLSKKAKMSSAIHGPLSEYYTSMSPFIERLMSLSPVTAEEVAEKILHTMQTRPSRLRVAGTPDVAIFAFARRLIPSRALNRILYWILPGSMKWGGKWKTQTSSLVIFFEAYINSLRYINVFMR